MSKVFVIAQGGGPTAVINATLAGAVTQRASVTPAPGFSGRAMGCAASATIISSTCRTFPMPT
jgi:hypothetical protein